MPACDMCHGPDREADYLLFSSTGSVTQTPIGLPLHVAGSKRAFSHTSYNSLSRSSQQLLLTTWTFFTRPSVPTYSRALAFCATLDRAS